MTLSKLAFKNMKTQFRDYFVYFVSMSFSIMVYFTFILMAYSPILKKVAENSIKVDTLLQVSSVMILIFVVLFMFYSNAFFIKKRKKEIGLYNLLGMRKWQIAQLFFLENLILGAGALLIGILLGSLLSKLFAMILLAVMRLKIDFHFNFSSAAISQTCLVFFFIFVIVAIQNASLVYRYKIIDLFKASGVGNQIPKATVFTLIRGLLGIFLIGLGYWTALNLISILGFSSSYIFLGIVLSIVINTVVGTYLFFNAFLVILIKFSQRQKKLYYRGLNLLMVSSLLFRLKRNAITLATIAVLSATTLCAVGGAAALYTFTEGTIDLTTSFDIHYEASNTKVKKIIEDTLNEFPKFKISEEATGEFKVISGKFEHSKKETANFYSVISESDYNKIVGVSNYGKKINLKDSSSGFLISQYFLSTIFDNPIQKKIQLKNQSIAVTIQGFDDHIPFGTRAVNGDVLVVTDELYKKIKNPVATFTRRGIMLSNYADSQALNKTLADRLESYNKSVFLDSKEEDVFFTPRDLFVLRQPYEATVYSSVGSIMYVAIFLGLVFMFATGSIIMLKQLSEAEEELHHYRILKKIGVSSKEIQKSIYRQTAFVFAFPIIIGSLHTYVAIHAMSKVLLNTDLWLGYVASACFILIYSIFYLFTARAYIRIVNRKV